LGLQVNHKCENRYCVNPTHLYLGTQKDNMRDRLLSGGYDNQPKGDAHYNSKLSDADVCTIRASTEAQITLANRFGVSRSLISLIMAHKRR